MNARKLLVSILMFVSVLLSACAPVATPPAPTVVPPTVAPTTAPTQEGLTTFSPKTFNLHITVSYGPEWSIAEEYSDVFTLSYVGHDAGVSFMNVKNTKIADGIAFPDDFVTWIQSPDSLFQVEDSKPVLVGGFKGIQINAIAACGDKKNWIMLSGTGWGCPGVEHIGFIYLDNVNGERVLIQIQGSPDGKDYEFIVEESQKVLDTVAFSKPTTFLPKTFDMPITFGYDPDWKIDSEVSSQVSFTYKGYDGYFSFVDPKTAKVAGPAAPYSIVPFPADFGNWIQAHGLIQVVKTKSVIVGGLPGTQIDADATAACGEKTNWFLVGTGGWNCSFVDGHYRFIYMDDVNGERLLIMTQANISAQDFVLMTDAAQKILDTVVFSKP